MSFSRKWSPEAINRKADNTITFKSPGIWHATVDTNLVVRLMSLVKQ
jgi:hypothetical protein